MKATGRKAHAHTSSHRRGRAWGVNLAYIALGGNIGDVRACFVAARKEIDDLPGVAVRASSLLYITPPLGPKDQPDYLNAMIAVATDLTPQALLAALQRIEEAHGRVRRERWGPRTLDLDLIAFNDLHLESETLTLPHKEMHKRQFVLRPLCDLAPDWRHPRLGKSARALLEALLQSGEEELRGGETW